MRVAFLGLGRMGAPMAAHVVHAGHDLVVWNRSPGRASDLVHVGAHEAGSVAEAVGDVDVVVTMLFGPDAVEHVMAEVATAARPDTLVVDCSTIGPEAAERVATLLATSGLRFVDAPVIGSVKPATDGTLGVVAGGNRRDFADAEPLLRLWGDPERVRHVGAVGAGNAVKLVVNLTLGVVMGGIGEAMRLGTTLGLDRGPVLDVLAWGPVGFTVGQKRPMLESGTYTPANFSLDLLAKDLTLCLDAAKDTLPHVAAALTAARGAAAAGHGGDDYAALAGWVSGDLT